ncbi:MAG TPA: HD domain-containing protein [Actinomycetota bacterium]|nr:HD domain-containing protein [Actinomycetota bacterium]
MTVPTREPHSERFAEALREAALWVSERGVARPRLAHGRLAATLVVETEADPELAVAALLHDVAEHEIDDARMRAVRDRFGERVARVVAWCSENGTHPMPPFRGLDEYRVAELLCATRDTLVVAAADTVAALRILVDDLGRGPVEAVSSPATAAAAIWFLGEVAGAIQDRLPGHALAAETVAVTAVVTTALSRRAPLSAAS